MSELRRATIRPAGLLKIGPIFCDRCGSSHWLCEWCHEPVVYAADRRRRDAHGPGTHWCPAPPLPDVAECVCGAIIERGLDGTRAELLGARAGELHFHYPADERWALALGGAA